MRQLQNEYEGAVEVEVSGIRYGAVAHLTSYVEVIDARTFGGTVHGEEARDGVVGFQTSVVRRFSRS